MNAPVLRIDLPGQRLEVGGVELVQLAPLEQCVDDRVVVAQLLEHAGVRRQLALRGLLPGLQSELVVEHLTQLRWRVQVELATRLPEDLRSEGRHPIAHPLGHLVEVGSVQPHATRLHPRQHGRQRQLDVGQQRPQPGAIHPLLQLGREQGHRRRLRGRRAPLHAGEELPLALGPLERGHEIGPEVGLGQRGERVGTRRRIEQVAREHRVEHDAAQLDARCERSGLVAFRVVDPQGRLRVGERRARTLEARLGAVRGLGAPE